MCDVVAELLDPEYVVPKPEELEGVAVLVLEETRLLVLDVASAEEVTLYVMALELDP